MFQLPFCEILYENKGSWNVSKAMRNIIISSGRERQWLIVTSEELNISNGQNQYLGSGYWELHVDTSQSTEDSIHYSQILMNL
jgi:hypothetical protein